MKFISNMFLLFSLISCATSRNSTITFVSLNIDVLLDVEKSNNRLLVYDHILNASTVFHRTNGSLYTNEYGDEIIWRNSRSINFRPKRWRNFISLEVVRNADIVIEVKKNHKINNLSKTPHNTSFKDEIINLSLLEGTWQSQNPEKSLVLLSTRDGFKVKFLGGSKWTNFYITDQKNTFKDDKDNLYFFNSYKEGTWHAKDNELLVNISKVSNDLRY